jgi:arsenate reductase
VLRVKALFVCIGNAGRSQMSEALFSRAAQGRHEARSAGTQPAASVHPVVVEAMAELGIDLSTRVPRRLERCDAEWADVVVTMGCGDACPVILGKRYIDWQLEDPKDKGIERVREIRDEIAARVEQLLEELAGERER